MLKKMILAGLMTATVLGGIAPAYAQRGDEGGGRWRGDRAGQEDGGRRDGGDRGQRWQGGGDRGQQAQRQQWEQRRSERAAERPDQPRIQQRGDGDRQGSVAWSRDGRAPERNDRVPSRDDRRIETRQDWRDTRRDDRRDNRWSNDGRRWNGNVGVARRFDDRSRWNGQRRWDNGWRQDRRYDWRSYRSRYGDRYRAGRYYAPRGWDYGYTRFSIGIFLNNMLFADSYWIDDPYSYRLPPAYGTLRWVRYYDDALLVDIRDGYVVDVIHDFFW
ncbi:MAG TPA: RcnB family protein [Sphingobium sp.]|nr:RcnB family protein [Sphingobium sp.]